MTFETVTEQGGIYVNDQINVFGRTLMTLTAA